jgi:hypothetical protein
MRYMLLFVANEGDWLGLSEEDRADAIRRIGEWYGRHAGEGRIVEGARLQPPGSAATVRLGPAGRSTRPVVKDGPFVEGKEAIGSYAILEVHDRDAAVEVASSWPGGGLVEVRPLME